MSDDGKIGLQISRVVPISAARKSDDVSNAAYRMPARTRTPPDHDGLPRSQLIGLAHDIAGQPAPVDKARVNAIRDAIADGSYRLDAAATARAMVEFHASGPDA